MYLLQLNVGVRIDSGSSMSEVLSWWSLRTFIIIIVVFPHHDVSEDPNLFHKNQNTKL